MRGKEKNGTESGEWQTRRQHKRKEGMVRRRRRRRGSWSRRRRCRWRRRSIGRREQMKQDNDTGIAGVCGEAVKEGK